MKALATILQRHIIKNGDEDFFVSIDLLNLISEGEEAGQFRIEIGHFEPERMGFVSANRLPTFLRVEIQEWFALAENKILSNDESQGSLLWFETPSYIREQVEDCLDRYPQYIDYFKDIFSDQEIALSKARTVCVYHQVASRKDNVPYLQIAFQVVKLHFPTCELLGDDLKTFRENIIQYSKNGLLPSLIESAL